MENEESFILVGHDTFHRNCVVSEIVQGLFAYWDVQMEGIVIVYEGNPLKLEYPTKRVLRKNDKNPLDETETI